MITMRAKLKVTSVTVHETCDIVKMAAVCKDDYDSSGLDENNTYAVASPSAEFGVTIANPALFGKFRPGQQFYVEFKPV